MYRPAPGHTQHIKATVVVVLCQLFMVESLRNEIEIFSMGNKQGGRGEGGDFDNQRTTKLREVANSVSPVEITLHDRLQNNGTTVASSNSSTSPEILQQSSLLPSLSVPVQPPPPPTTTTLSVIVQPPPPPPPSPPPPPPIRRPSGQRPRGVADMEIKGHCEKIKRFVGASRLSQMDLLQTEKVTTVDDESIMYECFVSIVQIAQNCAPLDGSVLDDYLITCHALRMNQPNLASKFALLMSQARELIEELIVPADGMGTTASLILQRSTSSLLLPPSRRPGNDSSKDQLECAVIPKLTKMISSQQLVDDAEKSLNCSQHSTDYGFLDLSAHFASPGVSQHGMSRHAVVVTAMQHQYDVARAELDDVDHYTRLTSSSVLPTAVGPPTIQVTTVIVPNTLGQGTSK